MSDWWICPPSRTISSPFYSVSAGRLLPESFSNVTSLHCCLSTTLNMTLYDLQKSITHDLNIHFSSADLSFSFSPFLKSSRTETGLATSWHFVPTVHEHGRKRWWRQQTPPRISTGMRPSLPSRRLRWKWACTTTKEMDPSVKWSLFSPLKEVRTQRRSPVEASWLMNNRVAFSSLTEFSLLQLLYLVCVHLHVVIKSFPTSACSACGTPPLQRACCLLCQST